MTNYPRLAIVTGADSGIGKATAELLATEGFDVGITAHEDVEGARDTAAAIEERGQRCFVEQFDAASPEAGTTIERLADELGGLSVLVNVAGTGHSSRVSELTFEKWRHVLATDLDGPFLCAHAAARRLLLAGHPGRLSTVISVDERHPRLRRRA